MLTLQLDILCKYTNATSSSRNMMDTAILNLQHCDFVIYSNVSNSIKIIVAFDEKYAENLLKTLKINYLQKMLHEICTHSRVV